MEKVDVAREQALKILIKVFESGSYSNILIKNLEQKLSHIDRAFITEIVYGTIKWRNRLDYAINWLSSVKIGKINKMVLCILRMGIYQIELMSKVPESAAVNESVKLAKKYSNLGAAKYVNAVLRNYLRNRESIGFPDPASNTIEYLSVFYSYPEWMVKRLIDEHGADFTEKFLISSNEVPPLTVRVNRLKTDTETLKRGLIEKEISVTEGMYLQDALVLKGIPGIENIEEYKNGYFTVQDESSMLAVHVLSPQPGDLVMDVCSAPGTKSTYMAEVMGNCGKIIAGDISASKLRLVEENTKRLGIDIVQIVCNDASKTMEGYAGMADKVLIDAPCSGLGIMRKKPEIRWNKSLEDIRNIEEIQYSILNASCNLVKLNGIVVYSTCTILKNENIGLVNKFLESNKNFVLEDITSLIPDKLKRDTCKRGYIEIYPNVDYIDGFFIARMRRVK